MFGKIVNYKKENSKLIINFEKKIGIIDVINPHVINIFSPLKYEKHFSRAIETLEYEECEINFQSFDTYLELSTNALIIKIYDDFKVDFYDSNKQLLCEDYRDEREPFIRRGDSYLFEQEGHKSEEVSSSHKIEIIKKMYNDEKFYGLGEKTGHLNKKGYEYTMWNTDDASPHVESHKTLYKSIPFFITLRKNTSFGIFFDNTFKTYFDMGKENSNYYYFGADDGNLDYYFIAGPEFNKVVSRYTSLTGTTPLPQMWTLGHQQSRYTYDSKERLLEIADNFREKDIPCDVLHLDIDYMDDFKVFTWDEKKFPSPKEITKELSNNGFKVVTIIDPGVKKARGYSMYDEGLKNGFFATDKDGVTYINKVWPGDSAFPDFSDTLVRDWWADKQKLMIDSGVSGIWNDMNEPASFNGPLPDDVQFKNDGRPTDHREVHNVYGHLMSKATFNGIKKYTAKRPFVITRACYAGSQKYSTAWTGDNQSSWEHLRMAVPMLLNLGISGMAFVGTDVGGFISDCTPELLSRWVQIGCFSPLFRNHSAVVTRDQEPWSFDDTTSNIYRKYVKLRYKLIPYLYDLMKECESNGLPAMRPLVLHYTDDKNVHELNDEFLFGESILVAPILEQGKNFRAVYLPDGYWIDYWTGEIIKGQNHILKKAELDTCPIYIKKGSIIPNYPELNYIGEKEVDTLTLDIYPGNGNYTHYQDDGSSYNYKNGEFNLYKFTMTKNEDTIIKIEIPHKNYEEFYMNFKIKINDKNTNNILFNGEILSYDKTASGIEFIIPAVEGQIKF
ncbi:glycoside hydrolase family 31 protein [Clostridium grantii]|uniref:Alpha-glucosidase n=1 Tax=Clostridium grantii DSM 8605 TaxID=1121316 RepID=A0A1M5UCK1_9CLOT|nr:glycoside hydrolase family 31 protein [Clostridium grantii]SHH60403.1 alpha-glucosidase [Clostridium grantii DSM 8605]